MLLPIRDVAQLESRVRDLAEEEVEPSVLVLGEVQPGEILCERTLRREEARDKLATRSTVGRGQHLGVVRKGRESEEDGVARTRGRKAEPGAAADEVPARKDAVGARPKGGVERGGGSGTREVLVAICREHAAPSAVLRRPGSQLVVAVLLAEENDAHRGRQDELVISDAMPPPLPPFVFPTLPSTWFIGHMSRALREMSLLIQSQKVDLVIETRDSRLPLTSINPTFESILNNIQSGGLDAGVEDGRMGGQCKRLIVYNKRDLGQECFVEVSRDATRLIQPLTRASAVETRPCTPRSIRSHLHRLALRRGHQAAPQDCHSYVYFIPLRWRVVLTESKEWQLVRSTDLTTRSQS